MADAKILSGLYRANVVNTDDPEKRLRIKCSCPMITGNSVTAWCEPCVPCAQDVDGDFYLPTVGETVWLSFEQDDPTRPVWLGSWFTSQNSSNPTYDKETRIISWKGSIIVMNKDDLHLSNNGSQVDINAGGVTITSGGDTVAVGSGAVTITQGSTINLVAHLIDLWAYYLTDDIQQTVDHYVLNLEGFNTLLGEEPDLRVWVDNKERFMDLLDTSFPESMKQVQDKVNELITAVNELDSRITALESLKTEVASLKTEIQSLSNNADLKWLIENKSKIEEKIK